MIHGSAQPETTEPPWRRKVGVRVPPVPPSPRLRKLVERLVAGGADSLWWGDHLMGFASTELWEGWSNQPDELSLHLYSDPFVCMAALSDVLGSVDVGTCVTDAIRRIPASLVQTVMTVDHAVQGRVILGIGAGEAANYRPYGHTVESPAQWFDVAVRQIHRFLHDPGPDEDGGIVAIRPPAESSGPELWLAAHGPRGLRLTGEIADGWFPMPLDVTTWMAGRNAIRESASQAGREPDAITMAMSLDVVIQDTRHAAERLLKHPAIRQSCLVHLPSTFARYGVEHPLGGSAVATMIPTKMPPGALLRATQAVPDKMVSEQVIHGTVEDVVEAIEQYDGLQHVRLSDLSAATGDSRGGLERLLAVVSSLKRVPAELSGQ